MKSSSKSGIKLSIVILSYNVEKLLLECLASIPKHTDWEIIVVDNGSTDSSLASIRKSFAGVKIIENGRNLGFSAANNIAIKQSVGEYVLLLNPDTVIKGQAIETVLAYLENNPGVGAATCRVELANGALDYSSHRGFPTPGSALLHFMGLKKYSSYTKTEVPNTIHEIAALTGAFAMIRRTVGEQVQWLDEDYFWNGEDIDLCYKIKERGWKIIYIPNEKIIHYKGASSQATRETKQRWALNSTQVMKLFYKKHLAKKYPFFVNWTVLAGVSVLELVRKIKAFL